MAFHDFISSDFELSSSLAEELRNGWMTQLFSFLCLYVFC